MRAVREGRSGTGPYGAMVGRSATGPEGTRIGHAGTGRSGSGPYENPILQGL
jgi:hypothetical protein